MREKQFRHVGSRYPRIDSRNKVTGKIRFPTDIYDNNMLQGSVLRSSYAHARILKINVEKARKLPGVVVVLTHRDIPGENKFGIVTPNWPVLCSDRVRYRGDAVALVAAEDEETAMRALKLIEIDYDPLSVVDTSEAALKDDAPLLYEDGNILAKVELCSGDNEGGLAKADYVLEETYTTQYQEHAYLETEGGIAEYNEKEGVITIRCGDQWPFLDQMQIARSLGWDAEKIRVVGSYCGGAFGGKYEINAQIHLALLAYYSKRPVRLHWNRRESILAGEKRHPMRTTIKIGAARDGELTAIDTDIVANTGPYGGIGSSVLTVAVHNSPGPYRYGSAHVKGSVVYTNGAICGGCRGFGIPQVTFAREQTLDILARKLRMDPIQLRLVNAVNRGDRTAIGHTLQGGTGIRESLRAAAMSELWRGRDAIKRRLNKQNKYKQYGIGVAASDQDNGLGPVVPDYSNVAINLNEDGRIILYTGMSEVGQGILTVSTQILAESLGCGHKRIEVINGDTLLTPDSGPIAASRGTIINGRAILAAAEKLKNKLIEMAARIMDIPAEELVYRDEKIISRSSGKEYFGLSKLGKAAADRGRSLRVIGSASMPVSDREYGNYFYTYITQIALVGVDTGTGEIELVKLISFPEIGRAVNPAAVEGQCEGGMVMGQGYALSEQISVADGRILNSGYSTYIIPTALDIPILETVIIEKPYLTEPFGVKGIGEAPIGPVAPAVANALYDAVGIRCKELPLTPEKVRSALISFNQRHKSRERAEATDYKT